MSKNEIKLLLTEQEFEDLASCVNIASKHYERKIENPNFMKAIDKLSRKLWKMRSKGKKKKVSNDKK